MLSLQVPAQNYAWGRSAETSEVASLAQANGSSIDPAKPFAELWVGTHPSGPALLKASQLSLKEWILRYPQSVGQVVYSRWGAELPFLYKVLSVKTALSIQSHPDKKLAERLHAADPKNYKDDNHKPEMALALNDFRALCSFVSTEELKSELQQHPELRQCVGEAATAQFLSAENGTAKAALKTAFTALMTCDAEVVKTAIEQLVARLIKASGERELTLKEQLVLELNEQYPNDVGVLSAFFLNLITLQPGQAIYLAANEPHAYVSGELMECMATSDNVVRAGLTPKFRDTDVLCESLTYNQGLPDVLDGTPVGEFVKVYQPPFDEFEVRTVSLPTDKSTAFENQGPMLLVVQKGAGMAAAEGPLEALELQKEAHVTRGDILFVPAGTKVDLQCTGEPLLVWVAACNSNVFAVPVERPVHVNEEAVLAN